MMIKIFLITFLCAILVFADKQVQDFQDASKEPINRFLSMAHNVRGNNLVRRSARDGGKAGFEFTAGFGFAANLELNEGEEKEQGEAEEA